LRHLPQSAGCSIQLLCRIPGRRGDRHRRGVGLCEFRARRYACRACAAPVYSHYDRPDEIDLYPGSFDEPGPWQPTYELWACQREAWLPEFASVVRRYESNRPEWRRTEGD
jgi:hypothetical protein